MNRRREIKLDRLSPILLSWWGARGRWRGFQPNRKRRRNSGRFKEPESRKRGGKGGRNKFSASNRGRVLARFYSQTLNSIAIGFPGSSLPRARASSYLGSWSFSFVSFLLLSRIHAHGWSRLLSCFLRKSHCKRRGKTLRRAERDLSSHRTHDPKLKPLSAPTTFVDLRFAFVYVSS